MFSNKKIMASSFLKYHPRLISIRNGETLLLRKMRKIVPKQREYFKKWKTENGHKILNKNLVVSQSLGMKGIIGMISETSMLEPNEGIRYRGLNIKKVCEVLPKISEYPESAKNVLQPLPEGVIWLFLTGKLPTEKEVRSISEDLMKRSQLPELTKRLIDSYPKEMHPMVQLS
ncbi:hypothetical protein MHBO_004619, partial [Bonamia ostreae]